MKNRSFLKNFSTITMTGTSPVIEADGTLYLSGVTAARKDKPISTHPEEQFHDAFYKLGVYLNAAGLDYEHILEMTTFHIDLKTHRVFSKVKDVYPPTRHGLPSACQSSFRKTPVEMRIVAKRVLQADGQNNRNRRLRHRAVITALLLRQLFDFSLHQLPVFHAVMVHLMEYAVLTVVILFDFVGLRRDGLTDAAHGGHRFGKSRTRPPPRCPSSRCRATWLHSLPATASRSPSRWSAPAQRLDF